MEKDFFEVFPNLKVKKELEELLDMELVTTVSCNPAKTHIWVYIRSERWIHKKHIFELEDQIERQITNQIKQLKQNGDVEKLLHGSWSHMEAFDEDEWLEHLEEHLKEIVNISGKDERTLAARFEEHRREIHERIMKEHPELAQRFKERRHRLDEHLKERRPEVYDLVVSLRELEKRKDME